MPTLFISYKRGDSAVEPIVKQLQATKYRTWFDKEDIVTGTAWRESIRTGIEQSAAIIVMLSPEACDSQYVKGEVRFARRKRKPIFPVITRKVSNDELDKLGLAKLQHVDFTEGQWDRKMKRLLQDLKDSGIRVTRHEERDMDPDRSLRHQHYLRGLRDRIGYLKLSRVALGQRDVSLERVYIPPLIDLAISIEVKNYKTVESWMSKRSDIAQIPEDKQQSRVSLRQVFGPGAESAAFDALVGQIQEAIDRGVDSEYDDPRQRPLVLAPPWYDGVKEGFWPLEAIDATAMSSRLVILGAPGSGKTTFARHLALCLLGSQYTPPLPGATLDELGAWPHGLLTPLYIELRQLVSWKGFPRLGETVTADHFWTYVTDELLGSDLEKFAKDLQDDLIEGHAVIILDGLDEVPIPPGKEALDLRRGQLQDLARSLDTVYPQTRMIFTSRTYGYQGWELEGFKAVTLIPLNTKLMRGLATNLYRGRGMNEVVARAMAEDLMVALESVPAALKDYPLFLTLMATLFLHGDAKGLPARKGALYHESIMLLLERWTLPRLGEDLSLAEQIGCDATQLYERLEVVAYKTQANATAMDTAPPHIGLGTLLVELFRLDPPADVHKLLAYLSQQAGVLVSPEPEVYQFAHRGFQEYLAAAYLARQDGFSLVRESIEQQPQIWREPCLLLGDVLTETGRSDKLWDVIDALLDGEQPDMLPADSPRWWSVWLAARTVLDQGLYIPPIQRRDQPVYNNMCDWLKLLLSTYEALPPVERAEVGKCLGLMGDDRPGVGVKDGIPDILWCTIPAGEFEMGTTQEQMKQMQSAGWATFTREKPETVCELPEFRISRYPITLAQFQAFVDARDGYFEQKWWTSEGRAWLQETGGPVEPAWGNTPNLPSTNVSWYEAVAFCNWLSDKVNRTIRLPTEAEWEKAARGIDGRLFPWGNEFDSSKCNMNQTGIGQPSAAGCFLLPESPWGEQGPLDMSGNVWEWCTTICEEEGGKAFSYPYDPSDGRETLELGDRYLRVVRGGAYLNPAFLVRTAFRGRDKPSIRFGRQGFRIVCERSP